MYKIHICQHRGLHFIKTEAVENPSREEEPYLVDLQTMTTFLLLFDRRAQGAPWWQSETWVPIRRIDIV